MKQNNILNTIAVTAMALVIAVIGVQAAGAVNVGFVGFPTDIAVDPNGNIYVTDTEFNNIDIINMVGLVPSDTRQLVGVGLIDFPSGVALEAGTGRIYVADDGNNSIKVFSSTTGDLMETIGLGQLNSPNGVAVDSEGHVYVADSGNNRIQIFESGGTVRTVGIDQLNFPSGVAVDTARNIYVADSGNDRIVKFNLTGVLQQTITGLKFPNDVDVDGSGNIYVADTANDAIKVFNPDGSLKQAIGTRGALEGQFDLPMGLALDSAGNIYVADGNNNRVQVITPAPVTVIANITAFSVSNGNRAGSIQANVTVKNLDTVPHMYAVVVSGVSAGEFARGYPLAGTGVVSLNPGQSIRVPVLVTVPASADVGSYSLLAGVFPFDNEILDPASLIGNLAGPATAVVS